MFISGRQGAGFHDYLSLPVPEFIDPVFGKTSPKRSFSFMQNERFGHVFAKTGSINSGTGKPASALPMFSIWANPFLRQGCVVYNVYRQS